YSAVKLRDLLSKSQPSHTPEPWSMCTSSPSMRKNLCASSTTLASFCSGTPAPPRFNSIRIRRRDIDPLSTPHRGFQPLPKTCPLECGHGRLERPLQKFGPNHLISHISQRRSKRPSFSAVRTAS